jgi:hypothetical protein
MTLYVGGNLSCSILGFYHGIRTLLYLFLRPWEPVAACLEGERRRILFSLPASLLESRDCTSFAEFQRRTIPRFALTFGVTNNNICGSLSDFPPTHNHVRIPLRVVRAGPFPMSGH